MDDPENRPFKGRFSVRCVFMYNSLTMETNMMDTTVILNDNRNMRRRWLYAFVAIVILVVVGAVGYVVWQSSSKDDALPNEIAAIQEELAKSGLQVEVTKDDAEQVVPTIAVPDLNRQPVFGTFATSPLKEQSALKIRELQQHLKKDPSVFMDWIELGLTFSSVGDHEAAIPAYEYAAALRPKSALPLANMGFVYGWHLKEANKAEAAYIRALEISPGEWYINQQLFELYRDVMGDYTKARSFAVAQMKAVPDFALDFKQLIADLDRRSQ